jgi:hypothetical protein
LQADWFWPWLPVVALELLNAKLPWPLMTVGVAQLSEPCADAGALSNHGTNDKRSANRIKDLDMDVSRNSVLGLPRYSRCGSCDACSCVRSAGQDSATITRDARRWAERDGFPARTRGDRLLLPARDAEPRIGMNGDRT